MLPVGRQADDEHGLQRQSKFAELLRNRLGTCEFYTARQQDAGGVDEYIRCAMFTDDGRQGLLKKKPTG
jgi:hypothetical protein